MTMQNDPFASAPNTGNGNDASGQSSAEDGGSAGGASTKSKVSEIGQDLKTFAKDQLVEQADSAKEYAIRRIRRVGSALRWAGEGLREQDDLIAGYAERASERISTMADYVDSTNAQKVMEDAERLARERPALFFGGAFLLGLAAGRFLKSSQAGGEDSEAASFSSGEEQGSSGGQRRESARQSGSGKNRSRQRERGGSARSHAR
jgi:hypothetical protein